MKQRDKEPEGLGAIVVQALETMASRDASSSIVDAALKAAGLRTLPQDPVVLLAFLSGALYRTTAARLGEEWADALLADAKPILERAAEHAMALEEDEEIPDASPPPQGSTIQDDPFPLGDAAGAVAGVDEAEPEGADWDLGGKAFGALELEIDGLGAAPAVAEPDAAGLDAEGLELDGSAAEEADLEPNAAGPEPAELALDPTELDTDGARQGPEPSPAVQLDLVPRRAMASLGAPRPAKAAGRTRRTTDPMGSGVKSTRPPPRMSSPSKAPVARHRTAPGVGTSEGAQGGAPPGEGGAEDALQKAIVHRVKRDPRRPTLGYEAVVDDPGHGLTGRPCAVVAVADQTLRAVVARILRREGFGVVTAPDSAIGRLLSLRFSAALVVVDGLVQVDPTSLQEGASAWVILDPDVGPDPVVSDGCVRVGARPIDPAALVGAVDQIMPPGWRR